MWAAFAMGLVIRARLARWTLAVVVVHLSILLVGIFLVGILLAVLLASIIAMIMTVSMGRSSAMRHPPTTAEEMVAPSPRVRRTLWTLLVFAHGLGLGFVVAILSEKRVSRALLLKASNEVPEGS